MSLGVNPNDQTSILCVSFPKWGRDTEAKYKVNMAQAGGLLWLGGHHAGGLHKERGEHLLPLVWRGGVLVGRLVLGGRLGLLLTEHNTQQHMHVNHNTHPLTGQHLNLSSKVYLFKCYLITGN